MNTILLTQLPDTWESFSLFQVLNNYLRFDGKFRLIWWRYIRLSFLKLENLCHGRFHTHVRDTFAPQVIRYVDLMETTIAQSLFKSYEKEKWDSKG